MTLKERLMDDLKTSMKEKNTLKKNTITMLRSRIKQYEVDNRVTADDNLIMSLIQKEIKERNDTLDSLKDSDRVEMVKNTETEIKVLEEYLPEQLSDEELIEVVKKGIESLGASSMKDMGKVISYVKEEVQSKADAKRISGTVKSILSSL